MSQYIWTRSPLSSAACLLLSEGQTPACFAGSCDWAATIGKRAERAVEKRKVVFIATSVHSKMKLSVWVLGIVLEKKGSYRWSSLLGLQKIDDRWRACREIDVKSITTCVTKRCLRRTSPYFLSATPSLAA